MFNDIIIQRYDFEDAFTLHQIIFFYLGRYPVPNDQNRCSKKNKKGSRTEYFILYDKVSMGIINDRRLIGQNYGKNKVFHVASFMPTYLLN